MCVPSAGMLIDAAQPANKSAVTRPEEIDTIL
jgi:hypothetical protein